MNLKFWEWGNNKGTNKKFLEQDDEFNNRVTIVFQFDENGRLDADIHVPQTNDPEKRKFWGVKTGQVLFLLSRGYFLSSIQKALGVAEDRMSDGTCIHALNTISNLLSAGGTKLCVDPEDGQ